jgi:hypothetical protein
MSLPDNIVSSAGALIHQAITLVKDASDASNNSLTSYGKMLRLNSRVYIDASVSQDPVITDILKTVHTQYAAFILNALQMNQFVTKDKNVQDLLRVVATEDAKPHESVLENFNLPVTKTEGDRRRQIDEAAADTKKQADAEKKTVEDAKKRRATPMQAGAEVKSFAGDNHIPAGKIIEITLANPEHPNASVTLNLLVQLSPYLVPEQIAVQFITKNAVPSFFRRLVQWKTGEISFWRDVVLMSNVVNDRAKLRKMDPTGAFADMMAKQQTGRKKTMGNLLDEKADRARNIANSVLIFNTETVQRAKAEIAIDFHDYASRQAYFADTFAMIIVTVDLLYNQVTFYYNGIADEATFSFDQMRVSNKGGNNLDLMSVMNALNQGKSPKF